MPLEVVKTVINPKKHDEEFTKAQCRSYESRIQDINRDLQSTMHEVQDIKLFRVSKEVVRPKSTKNPLNQLLFSRKAKNSEEVVKKVMVGADLARLLVTNDHVIEMTAQEVKASDVSNQKLKADHVRLQETLANMHTLRLRHKLLVENTGAALAIESKAALDDECTSDTKLNLARKDLIKQSDERRKGAKFHSGIIGAVRSGHQTANVGKKATNETLDDYPTRTTEEVVTWALQRSHFHSATLEDDLLRFELSLKKSQDEEDDTELQDNTDSSDDDKATSPRNRRGRWNNAKKALAMLQKKAAKYDPQLMEVDVAQKIESELGILDKSLARELAQRQKQQQLAQDRLQRQLEKAQAQQALLQQQVVSGGGGGNASGRRGAGGGGTMLYINSSSPTASVSSSLSPANVATFSKNHQPQTVLPSAPSHQPSVPVSVPPSYQRRATNVSIASTFIQGEVGNAPSEDNRNSNAAPDDKRRESKAAVPSRSTRPNTADEGAGEEDGFGILQGLFAAQSLDQRRLRQRKSLFEETLRRVSTSTTTAATMFHAVDSKAIHRKTSTQHATRKQSTAPHGNVTANAAGATNTGSLGDKTGGLNSRRVSISMAPTTAASGDQSSRRPSVARPSSSILKPSAPLSPPPSSSTSHAGGTSGPKNQFQAHRRLLQVQTQSDSISTNSPSRDLNDGGSVLSAQVTPRSQPPAHLSPRQRSEMPTGSSSTVFPYAPDAADQAPDAAMSLQRSRSLSHTWSYNTANTPLLPSADKDDELDSQTSSFVEPSAEFMTTAITTASSSAAASHVPLSEQEMHRARKLHLVDVTVDKAIQRAHDLDQRQRLKTTSLYDLPSRPKQPRSPSWKTAANRSTVTSEATGHRLSEADTALLIGDPFGTHTHVDTPSMLYFVSPLDTVSRRLQARGNADTPVPAVPYRTTEMKEVALETQQRQNHEISMFHLLQKNALIDRFKDKLEGAEGVQLLAEIERNSAHVAAAKRFHQAIHTDMHLLKEVAIHVSQRSVQRARHLNATHQHIHDEQTQALALQVQRLKDQQFLRPMRVRQRRQQVYCLDVRQMRYLQRCLLVPTYTRVYLPQNQQYLQHTRASKRSRTEEGQSPEPQHGEDALLFDGKRPRQLSLRLMTRTQDESGAPVATEERDVHSTVQSTARTVAKEKGDRGKSDTVETDTKSFFVTQQAQQVSAADRSLSAVVFNAVPFSAVVTPSTTIAPSTKASLPATTTPSPSMTTTAPNPASIGKTRKTSTSDSKDLKQQDVSKRKRTASTSSSRSTTIVTTAASQMQRKTSTADDAPAVSLQSLTPQNLAAHLRGLHSQRSSEDYKAPDKGAEEEDEEGEEDELYEDPNRANRPDTANNIRNPINRPLSQAQRDNKETEEESERTRRRMHPHWQLVRQYRGLRHDFKHCYAYGRLLEQRVVHNNQFFYEDRRERFQKSHNWFIVLLRRLQRLKRSAASSKAVPHTLFLLMSALKDVLALKIPLTKDVVWKLVDETIAPADFGSNLVYSALQMVFDSVQITAEEVYHRCKAHFFNHSAAAASTGNVNSTVHLAPKLLTNARREMKQRRLQQRLLHQQQRQQRRVQRRQQTQQQQPLKSGSGGGSGGSSPRLKAGFPRPAGMTSTMHPLREEGNGDEDGGEEDDSQGSARFSTGFGSNKVADHYPSSSPKASLGVMKGGTSSLVLQSSPSQAEGLNSVAAPAHRRRVSHSSSIASMHSVASSIVSSDEDQSVQSLLDSMLGDEFVAADEEEDKLLRDFHGGEEDDDNYDLDLEDEDLAGVETDIGKIDVRRYFYQ